MFRLIGIFLLLLCIASAAYPQAKNRSTAWLNGTWEGKGYQIDSDTTWTMNLTVKGKRYIIEYPSLNCGGSWQRLSIGPNRARFRETITFGLEECMNKGGVVIERLSRRQVAFRYYNQGTRDVSASAILNRKR